MMRYFLVILTIIFCSCGSEPKTDGGAETLTEKGLEIAGEVSTNEADTLCFIKTAGTTNQDTTLIRLVIINNEVTGRMMNLPHQKDSRVGRISGTKDNDIVNCKWIYMQEGMIDSVLVSYKLEGDKLLQKAPSFDPKTGREVLPDSATYKIVFRRTDCGGIPRFDYDLGKIGL